MFTPYFSKAFIYTNGLLILCLMSANAFHYKQKTVYQKISTDEKFSNFNSLIQNSSLVKRAILYWNTTVFAPTNEAFEKFNGVFSTDLAYYHVSNECKSLRNIFESNQLHTLADGYPPLWISRINGGIFINNAKIVMKESDYFSRADGGYYNHNQVLHVIDDVLDPPNVDLENPTALELITNFTDNKFLQTRYFLDKINQLNLTKLFKENRANTYFIPIDDGFNENRLRMTDKYTVEAHIIPNQVLFTRPTIRKYYFESRSNGDYIYILLSFVDNDDKLFVRSNTVLGDSNHQKGEFLSEVVKANIPVKNGVVHFIKQPIGVFDQKLKPFPYLPILSKLSGDPSLNITYHLGIQTKFNEHLKNSNSLLTFFVPRDKGWRNIIENLSESTQEQVKLLGRHLVISDIRHTMDMLWYRSFNRIITLNTVGGPVDIQVFKDGNDNYKILYKNEYIKVYRPDYVCTNGIIHIIDRPFLSTINGTLGKVEMNFWKSLEDFVF